MIRRCSDADLDRIYHIVNEAAGACDGKIPPDCYHTPYMPMDKLKREFTRLSFYGWEEDGELVGVMCIEPVRDVILIRHAYALSSHLRRGIASRLLVGTWADYERYGFILPPDKDGLLMTYWDIPKRQIETSVVLGMVE